MSDDPKLSSGEIACIDAIKTILEVLIARDLITAPAMAVPYRAQAAGYLQKADPVAAAAMMLLVMFLEDPKRNATRDFLQKPPSGSA